MNPTEQAARWLADVQRLETWSGNPVIWEADALAAIARHLAPEERPDAPCHIVEYTNYRGETARRVIIPIRFWWGSTEWHPEEQWMLSAWDVEKNARRDFAWQDMRPVQNGATSAAVAARHLAPGDDLVAQATAALEGVTDGPWTIPGQPDKICAEGYTKNGAAKTIATVCTPSWMGTSEPWANACFIAFTRQWVPEAAAAITAMSAEAAELKAQVAELTKERDEALSAARQQDKLREATLRPLRSVSAARVAAEAKVARLEGALRKVAQYGGYGGKIARAALTEGTPE
jgi:hypothetical protein